MLYFTVFHNDELIKTYEFTDIQSITIGRLPDNHIPISSVSISRRHVSIEKHNGHQYRITDLKSLNGTFVNNKKVTSHLLNPGDKILIGKYAIVFENDPKAQCVFPLGQLPQNELPSRSTDTAPNPHPATQAPLPQPINPHQTNEIYLENELNFDPRSNQQRATTPVLYEIHKQLAFTLNTPLISLGASESDDIYIEGFPPQDGHILIEQHGPHTFYIHANQINGKFRVNGTSVTKHQLHDEDLIEIGSNTFRFLENGK